MLGDGEEVPLSTITGALSGIGHRAWGAVIRQTRPSSAPYESHVPTLVESKRHHRTHQIVSAWVTLVPSKAVTLLVQIVAIPAVYRTIGPVQFATYAAVTSAVSILGFLNLGMGGALVTPLAEAAVEGDHRREASLFGATLIPMFAVGGIGMCIAMLLLRFVPLETVFGRAASATAPAALRTAAVLACIGTLASIPLSVIDSARQAYQEMHITNLLGTLSNVTLCVALLLVAWVTPTLPAFVAATALVSQVGRVLNAAFLLVRRPYLMTIHPEKALWRLGKHLGKDGLSYMGVKVVANLFVYQWPVYYIARVQPPLESSTFAVLIQLTLLVVAFGVSIAQPLWGAVAEATAQADRAWVAKLIRRARAASVAYGACGLLAFGFSMNVLLKLWLHRPIDVKPGLRWLGGAYLLLAVWEYVHWPLTLGLGRMRAASNLMFLRTAVFALLVPFAARYGQVGVMALLCASVAFVTAWRFPQLLSRAFETTRGADALCAHLPTGRESLQPAENGYRDEQKSTICN